jgi:hypothetical protein
MHRILEVLRVVFDSADVDKVLFASKGTGTISGAAVL